MISVVDTDIKVANNYVFHSHTVIQSLQKLQGKTQFNRIRITTWLNVSFFLLYTAISISGVTYAVSLNLYFYSENPILFILLWYVTAPPKHRRKKRILQKIKFGMCKVSDIFSYMFYY